MRNKCIQELQCYKNYNMAVVCMNKSKREVEKQLHGFRVHMYLDVDGDANFAPDKINWDEIVEAQLDLILVILPLVYSRKMAIELGNFCKCFNIMLIDVYDHNLVAMYDLECKREQEYSQRNLEELKAQIDCHDVISFDIFDTLLCRKLIRPETVYEIVANRCSLAINEFQKCRIEAEKRLENPNIYEIYEELQKVFGWNVQEKQNVMQCEIQVEKEVLVQRKAMKEAFDYAKSQRKSVYILSDMYLTKNILNRILKKNGITGYTDIWISCERKKTKYEGMFKDFVATVGDGTYLHIGDNWSVDGICAEASGMDTYLIKGIQDLLRTSVYGQALVACKTTNDSILLGMTAERIFNNPFVFYQNTKESKSLKEIGYAHFGPVMSQFMIWLGHQLENTTYDKVIFPSRDGYLIHKLYQKYCEQFETKCCPEGIYIETSRNATMVADVRYKRDVKEMLKSCPYEDVGQILEKRFLVEPDERILDDNLKSTQDIIWQFKDKIVEKSYELQKAYQVFLKEKGVKLKKKYAFFDLVSTGTSQVHLENILKSHMVGVYFFRCEPDTTQKKNLRVEAFGTYQSQADVNSAVRRKYLLLEFVLSSDKPSVKYIDEYGMVHYEDEKRKKKEIQMMLRLQKGILEFFTEYLSLHCDSASITRQMTDYIFDCVDKKENQIKNQDFYKIQIYDDWSDVYIDCLNKC